MIKLNIEDRHCRDRLWYRIRRIVIVVFVVVVAGRIVYVVGRNMGRGNVVGARCCIAIVLICVTVVNSIVTIIVTIVVAVVTVTNFTWTYVIFWVDDIVKVVGFMLSLLVGAQSSSLQKGRGGSLGGGKKKKKKKKKLACNLLEAVKFVVL